MLRHLHFHGTARSGHHAVIYWLVGCMGEWVGRIHYANQVIVGRNPLCVDFVNNTDFPSKLSVRPIAPNMSPIDTDVLISSTEDAFDFEWDLTYRFPDIEYYEGAILRDPFNQLASRLSLYARVGVEWEFDKARFIDGFARLWLGHALRAKKAGPNFMLVHFNRWFDSEEYRRSLCDTWAERCALTFDDKYLNFVSDHGKGSSFHGRAFDGEGQRMAVHARWQEFRHDDTFWACLAAGGPELLSVLEDDYSDAAYLLEPVRILRRHLTRSR